MIGGHPQQVAHVHMVERNADNLPRLIVIHCGKFVVSQPSVFCEEFRQEDDKGKNRSGVTSTPPPAQRKQDYALEWMVEQTFIAGPFWEAAVQVGRSAGKGN
jgi:hypothetical protein